MRSVPVACCGDVVQTWKLSRESASAIDWWSVAMTTWSAPLSLARCPVQATRGLPPTSASIFPGRRVERMRAGMTTLKARRSSSGFLVGRERARLVLEHHGDVVLHREGEPVGLAHQLGGVLLPRERALAEGAHQDFKQLGIHRFGRGPGRCG